MALKTLALSQAGWGGGHSGGATTPGTAVTSRSVKVISDHPPQENQGFGRQGSSPSQDEAAASHLQAMGRALQRSHLDGIDHRCRIQTTEHELAPLCQARGLLNVAVSKM